MIFYVIYNQYVVFLNLICLFLYNMLNFFLSSEENTPKNAIYRSNAKYQYYILYSKFNGYNYAEKIKNLAL